MLLSDTHLGGWILVRVDWNERLADYVQTVCGSAHAGCKTVCNTSRAAHILAFSTCYFITYAFVSVQSCFKQ
jgi:hypothetical protein